MSRNEKPLWVFALLQLFNRRPCFCLQIAIAPQSATSIVSQVAMQQSSELIKRQVWFVDLWHLKAQIDFRSDASFACTCSTAMLNKSFILKPHNRQLNVRSHKSFGQPNEALFDSTSASEFELVASLAVLICRLNCFTLKKKLSFQRCIT